MKDSLILFIGELFDFLNKKPLSYFVRCALRETAPGTRCASSDRDWTLWPKSWRASGERGRSWPRRTSLSGRKWPVSTATPQPHPQTAHPPPVRPLTPRSPTGPRPAPPAPCPPRPPPRPPPLSRSPRAEPRGPLSPNRCGTWICSSTRWGRFHLSSCCCKG